MVDIQSGELIFEALAKGDYLSVPTVEMLTQSQVGTKAYQFALLGLRNEIEDELRKLHGVRFTLKCESDGLRILTDSEAADYNVRQIESSKGRIFRAYSRNRDVDERRLTAIERSSHQRNLTIGGAYTQALIEIPKSIPSAAHRRSTPGLPVLVNT